MRTRQGPVVLTACVRWCVLAWTALPQAAQAEQRFLLRVRRAEEARPVITLPQSLLLQRSDGERQDQNAEEEHGLSNADAAREIEAANRRGGYGNELWNSVQESAGEVVEDAREAFFAGEDEKACDTRLNCSFCIAKKPASGPDNGKTCCWSPSKKCLAYAGSGDFPADDVIHFSTGYPGGQVCPAPTTTTVATTTLDPAVIAKQLKMSVDAAKARGLLIGMISRAQLGLLNRLNDISMDLEATELRAKLDLQAVNHSFNAAKKMPMMASNAGVDVEKIETNGNKLKVSIPAIEADAAQKSTDIKTLIKTKEQLEIDIKAAKKLPGAKKRVQNNQQTLNALVPRLEQLESRVTKLEGGLYDGDLDKMVEDTTGKEVMNIMEDVSRGFGRFIEN